jgi:hypothetical protein
VLCVGVKVSVLLYKKKELQVLYEQNAERNMSIQKKVKEEKHGKNTDE